MKVVKLNVHFSYEGSKAKRTLLSEVMKVVKLNVHF